MGRELSSKRQYLYLSVACLILWFAPACMTPKQPKAQTIVRIECNHLKRVERLIGQGAFDEAISESQALLERSPKAAPGDAALMSLGLLHAHYANPKRDYKKSLVFFHRLEKEFPRSPLVEESRIWAGVLQAYEKAKQVDLEIEEKRKGLGK